MKQLPGWKPMTALGIFLASAGVLIFGLSVAVATLYAWVDSDPNALGWGLIAGMGYGFQLAFLGSLVCILSLAGEWFVRRARGCPLWSAAR
jgi:hypothetical protein